jgi:protein-S-isoprenylcysteine O-methyltransferase Ste14
MFRWSALAVFLVSLGIVAWRARGTREALPRARILMVSPLFVGVLTYLANPRWMAWASLGIPSWIRWIGVALGGLAIPLVYWVFTTFGAGASQAALSQQKHLVTTGPYRWVRHPMYAVGIALFVSLGIIAANWFILLWAMVILAALLFVAIPREETRLVAMFGDEYRDYIGRAGSFLPIMPSKRRRRRAGC